jgi:hypothetical protein
MTSVSGSRKLLWVSVFLAGVVVSGAAATSLAQQQPGRWPSMKRPAKPKVEEPEAAPAPPPIEAKRVSEVGGARWSDMVGFVAPGPAPGSREDAAPAGNLFVPPIQVTEGN